MRSARCIARIIEKWPGSDSSNRRFCLSIAVLWSALLLCYGLCYDIRGLAVTSFAASVDAFTLRDMMN